jgi:glycosyltransferase involved in cell wall biosynthesis
VIVSHLSIRWRGLPMLLSLRAANPKTLLVHIEHSYTESFVALNVTCKARFATLLRTAYALFDRVVAVSQGQARWLFARGLVRPEALSVIQSCVDLSAFRTIPRLIGPVRVIGAVGRFDRQKGFDTLIKAFRQCPEPGIALHLYGEGAEAESLRRLAAGDSRIRFMGFAPDPVTAIASVDAVAMPSRWEAYGLVAIEAISAGRPLLVNAVDGLTDHLSHGAQMVRSPSVRSWSRALSTLTRRTDASVPPVAVADHDTFEARFARNWQILLGCGEPI